MEAVPRQNSTRKENPVLDKGYLGETSSRRLQYSSQAKNAKESREASKSVHGLF